jgi:hypothetical protein
MHSTGVTGKRKTEMALANGTRVAFKFLPGFGVVDRYEEGEGTVIDYGFSMRTASENTYVIRTDDGREVHVMRWSVRKL